MSAISANPGKLPADMVGRVRFCSEKDAIVLVSHDEAMFLRLVGRIEEGRSIEPKSMKKSVDRLQNFLENRPCGYLAEFIKHYRLDSLRGTTAHPVVGIEGLALFLLKLSEENVSCTVMRG